MPLSMLPEDLTDAENKLVEAAKNGHNADYRTGNKQLDDLANGANWSPERTIRAEVIYALAVGDNPEVHAKGVQIAGAKIVGPLDLEGAQIPHPLVLFDCFIGEPITLRNADALSVNLDGSRVAEIQADRLGTRGDVFLRDGFHTAGEVRLAGAKIGGSLECSGGTFKNALNADHATVNGGVLLSQNFHAKSEVNLVAAKIGGDLVCSGGIFENALNANHATVNGGVFLSQNFHAKSEVNLVAAKIGAALVCSGGIFESGLNANSATIDGGVFLRTEPKVKSVQRFNAKGEVRLGGAKIGGQLACSGGTFENAKSFALNMDRATVTATLLLRELASPPVGMVNLGYAQVGELNDDEKSWPRDGKLYLDGFVYGRLAGEAPCRASDRLRWLGLQPDFRPQPYEQLVRVLKEMGHEREAREVAIAEQRRLREHGGLSRLSQAKNWLLDKTIRYGYESLRAFVWLFIAWLIGTGMFCMAEWTRVMVPSEKDAYHSYKVDSKSLPEGYPKFHAPLYALDLFVPGIDLHQKSKWYLREKHAAVHWYWIFEFGSVVYVIVCWILTLLGVGAVSGLVRPH